jgi:D-serine deaminase-like pyridoxal phosphate-dependent protein
MDKSVIGSNIGEINTPALLIDLENMEYNIKKMAKFFENKQANLRPHIKTHKTPALAHRQLEAGAIGITCQKLAEAEIMAKAGIRDILIANQIVGVGKILRLVSLAKWTELKVAVDSIENVQNIAEAAQNMDSDVGILIEINVGMNRCGVEPGEPALKLAREIEKLKGVHFEGLLGYEGHTVFIPSFAEREKEAQKALKLLIGAKDFLEKNGFECKIVSAGGTGTYSIAGVFPGVTEVEAGSYITMDSKYDSIEGIGGEFKQALTLLTTVISTPTEDRAILDAGKKSITEEFGLPQLKAGSQGLSLLKFAEEHGYVAMDKTIQPLKAGDQVQIVPSHGCTTFNLHDYFYGVRNGIVEMVVPIEARGKSG